MKVESLKKAKHSIFDTKVEEGEIVKDIQALQATIANIDSEKAPTLRKSWRIYAFEEKRRSHHCLSEKKSY